MDRYYHTNEDKKIRFIPLSMGIDSFINQILLILLIALIIYTPAYPYKKMIFLVGVFALWLVSTLTIDREWLQYMAKIIVLIFGMLYMDAYYSLAASDSSLLRTFFTQKLFVYIWLLVMVFYINHVELLGLPIAVILLMVAITCVYTIIGNLQVPGASRRLAAGGENAQFYHNLNIAGYDIIYGIVFLPMALIVSARKKVISPIISCTMIFLILVTLVIASYTLSILLALGMIICTLADPKNKKKFVLGVMIFTLILLILRVDILNIIIDIGNRINSYMLVRRATQIRDMTYFTDYGMTEYNRFVLYGNGILNFLHHPLFGKLTGVSSDYLHAGHSGLINYFETYGLFGIVYIFYWKCVYKAIASSMTTSELRNNYIIMFLFLMVFIITDTIDIAAATTLCSVFISPAILLYAEYLSNERTT